MVRFQPPVICASVRSGEQLPPTPIPPPHTPHPRPVLPQAGALLLLRPASLCPTSKSHTGRGKKALASAVSVSNGNTPGRRRSAPERVLPPTLAITREALGARPCEGGLGKPAHPRVSPPCICSLFFTRTGKAALTSAPWECHQSVRRRKEALLQERLLKSQS